MGALEVQRITEGLWRWTVPHPEWSPAQGGPGGWEPEVASIYHETGEGVALFDPLVPPEGTADSARFWRALDRDVARVGGRVAILLGNRRHVRSTRRVHERYAGGPGCSVHSRDLLPDIRADAGMLPAGIVARPIEGLDVREQAYWLTAHRALVLADVLIGTGGGVRVAARARTGLLDQEALRASLRALLALSPEMILVSHGPPVLSGGSAALGRALGA